MLTETAVGDAYGAAFEFTRTPAIANNLSTYGPHPKDGGPLLPAGSYTDDTLRSIANAEVVLAGEWDDPRAYAAAYQREHARDDRPGWSRGFKAMLEVNANARPQDFMRALRRRATNGCVMGAAPLGHLPTPDDVRLAATMQTVSTHAGAATPYVQIVALAAHHLLHGGTTRTVIDCSIDQVEWESTRQAQAFRRCIQEPPVPEMAAATIAAGALWALTAFEGMAEALAWTCSRGGDCDSLGAVTMALASVASDMRADLPDTLLDNVDTPANRRRLSEIDRRLAWRSIRV